MNNYLCSSQFYAPTLEGWFKLALKQYKLGAYNECAQIYSYLLEVTSDSVARRVCYMNLYQMIKLGFSIKLLQKREMYAGRPEFKIPLTMTTCKRYELFKKTLFTFFSKTTDAYCIKSIYVVDDGSSGEDLKLMEEDLKVLGLPYKLVAKVGGHGNSMNTIIRTVEKDGAPFFVHLEDDFEVVLGAPLISTAIEVLATNPQYSQCLFNNSYREYAEDVGKNPCGLRHRTPAGAYFYEHVWKDAVSNHSYSYWPGFSLTPAVNRLQSFLDVGPFVETGSFEKDYAVRLHRNGWRTAYLETVYLQHIGRKIAERDDPTKPNAYQLNGAQQFGPPTLKRITLKSTLLSEHFAVWKQLARDFRTVQAFYITTDEEKESLLTKAFEELSNSFEPWDIILVSNSEHLPQEYIIYFTGAFKLLKRSEATTSIMDAYRELIIHQVSA